MTSVQIALAILVCMDRKTLPIGIQTFREIREGDFYYIDKTGLALKLIEKAGCQFHHY